MIVDAVDWLLAKNIHQWTAPLPRHVYEARQRNGENYALSCDGDLAVVLSLLKQGPSWWADKTGREPFRWLSTIATTPRYRARKLGRRAIQEAKLFLRNRGFETVYLGCAHGNGFLPRYYESLGFEVLDRKDVAFPSGVLDMVLMRCSLKLTEKNRGRIMAISKERRRIQ